MTEFLKMDTNIYVTQTSGDGKSVGMVSPRGVVRSALPRMELMWWAMTFCCSTLQWFSKERMTG